MPVHVASHLPDTPAIPICHPTHPADGFTVVNSSGEKKVTFPGSNQPATYWCFVPNKETHEQFDAAAPEFMADLKSKLDPENTHGGS